MVQTVSPVTGHIGCSSPRTVKSTGTEKPLMLGLSLRAPKCFHVSAVSSPGCWLLCASGERWPSPLSRGVGETLVLTRRDERAGRLVSEGVPLAPVGPLLSAWSEQEAPLWFAASPPALAPLGSPCGVRASPLRPDAQEAGDALGLFP